MVLWWFYPHIVAQKCEFITNQYINLTVHAKYTSKGSCRSWKKIVKSLDDKKVQSAIQNVKGRSKMSKLS